jgi:hypothetical protein
MEQMVVLSKEEVAEYLKLREFKQKFTLTPDRQRLGGLAIGNRMNTCPNCGRLVKGNSGFGMHVKKCTASLDK